MVGPLNNDSTESGTGILIGPDLWIFWFHPINIPTLEISLVLLKGGPEVDISGNMGLTYSGCESLFQPDNCEDRTFPN